MMLMYFNSFKCCEIVACANPNSSTKSFQIQAILLMMYFKMAIIIGCTKDLKKTANLFCSSVNISDFVSPIILILTSQYYDNKFKLRKSSVIFFKATKALNLLRIEPCGFSSRREQGSKT